MCRTEQCLSLNNVEWQTLLMNQNLLECESRSTSVTPHDETWLFWLYFGVIIGNFIAWQPLGLRKWKSSYPDRLSVRLRTCKLRLIACITRSAARFMHLTFEAQYRQTDAQIPIFPFKNISSHRLVSRALRFDRKTEFQNEKELVAVSMKGILVAIHPGFCPHMRTDCPHVRTIFRTSCQEKSEFWI